MGDAPGQTRNLSPPKCYYKKEVTTRGGQLGGQSEGRGYRTLATATILLVELTGLEPVAS